MVTAGLRPDRIDNCDNLLPALGLELSLEPRQANTDDPTKTSKMVAEPGDDAQGDPAWSASNICADRGRSVTFLITFGVTEQLRCITFRRTTSAADLTSTENS